MSSAEIECLSNAIQKSLRQTNINLLRNILMNVLSKVLMVRISRKLETQSYSKNKKNGMLMEAIFTQLWLSMVKL